MRDVEEVLEELARDVLVGRVYLRQLDRDRERVERVGVHPARAIGLLDESAGRQFLAPVEDADVVEAEEAALEDVFPLRILAVDPPGEVQQQLLEDALEEEEIRAPV